MNRPAVSLNPDRPSAPLQTLSPHTTMSVNQRGRIVGQVVHPGVAASDRKQRRLSTPRPKPPTQPIQNIIEISSDEDEDLQPPSKKILIKRGHPSSTHESDYKARLSQKDHEIDRLKKVRRQRFVCAHFVPTLRCAERERTGTGYCNAEEGDRDEQVSCCPCAPNPHLSSPSCAHLPQKADVIEEELTCEICAMRMWTPYRCVSPHTASARWSLKATLA
jgi:hypothetical protein